MNIQPILRAARPGPTALLFAGGLLVGLNPLSAQEEPATAEDDSGRETVPLAELAGESLSSYHQVHHLRAGLELLHATGLDEELEVADWVAGLLGEDPETAACLEAVGGGLAVAWSDSVVPWVEVVNELSVTGSGATGPLNREALLAGFALTGGEIDPDQYWQQTFEGMSGLFAGQMMTAILERRDELEVPGVVVMARPSSDQGREHLHAQVDEVIESMSAGIPPWVETDQRTLGDFAYRSWSFRFSDLLTGGGQHEEILEPDTLAMVFSLEPADAADLGDWLREQTVVIGTGWNEVDDTMVVFLASSFKDAPLRSQGRSLLSERDDVVFLVEDVGDGFHYGGVTSAAASRLSLDSYRQMYERLLENCIEAGQAYPNNLRAKTIAQAAARLQEHDPFSGFKFDGPSLVSLSLDEGLQLEVVSGVTDSRLDLGQPIACGHLLEGDSALAAAGAISPAWLHLGLALAVDGVELGVPLAVQLQEVNSLLGNQPFGGIAFEADESTPGPKVDARLLEFEVWLESGSEEPMLRSFEAVGAHLEQGLDGQAGLVVEAAATESGGPPQTGLLLGVADPEALDAAWPDLQEGLRQLGPILGHGAPKAYVRELMMLDPPQVGSGEPASWVIDSSGHVFSRSEGVIALGSSTELNEDLMVRTAGAGVADPEMTGLRLVLRPASAGALLEYLSEQAQAGSHHLPAPLPDSLSRLADYAEDADENEEWHVWVREENGAVRTTVWDE